MELYIKNNWLQIKGDSIVQDVNNNDIYKVYGEVMSLELKKKICDLYGNIIYVVKNEAITLFTKTSYIYDSKDSQIAELKLKLPAITLKIYWNSIYGDISILGNYNSMSFDINLNGVVVGKIERQYSMRDSFILKINDDVDISFFVSVVIALDNLIDDGNQRRIPISVHRY